MYESLGGEFAVYHGFTVKCCRYADRYDVALLLTEDPAIATELGFVMRQDGRYVADVARKDLTSIYYERWWGELDGVRVELVAERDGCYYVSTTDRAIADKWGLRDVERGMWWEGLVPKHVLMNVQVERRDSTTR